MIHALHGNFGLPGDWLPVLENLQPPVAFHSWHLWKTRRDWPETGDLKAWASRFCRACPGESGIVAGYSLGARLALHAVLANPAQWRAAILLAPHPGLVLESQRNERRAADERWAERCLTLPWPELWRLWDAQSVLVSPAAGDDDSPARREETGFWKQEIASAFHDWSTGAQRDLRPLLRGLRIPVLWLTGDRDEKFTALAEECAAENPLIEHRILPDCGHRLLREAPLEVAERISIFLRRHPIPA